MWVGIPTRTWIFFYSSGVEEGATQEGIWLNLINYIGSGNIIPIGTYGLYTIGIHLLVIPLPIGWT